MGLLDVQVVMLGNPLFILELNIFVTDVDLLLKVNDKGFLQGILIVINSSITLEEKRCVVLNWNGVDMIEYVR